MSKITYANKVALNEEPEIADINKVKDTDMNEIKSVVNENDDNVGDLTSLTTEDKSSVVGAINEVNEVDVIQENITTQRTAESEYNYFCPFNALTGAQEKIKLGDKFTIINKQVSFGDRTSSNVYGIEIGVGVSVVETDFSVRYSTDAMTIISTDIWRERDGVCEIVYGISDRIESTGTAAASRYTAVGSSLIDVQEGDFLFVASYKSPKTAAVIVYPDDNATNFHIKRLK